MRTFSIVIPAYDNLPLLQQALASVLRQEGTDYEVIITDDSSNDDIRQYINSLNDDRIHYVRHHQGQSAAENWNYGLQQATGQYLILMHHDERMKSPYYLRRVGQLIPGYDIIVSKVEVSVNSQQRHRRFPKWMLSLSVRHPALLFFLNAIGPCACVTFRCERLQTFDTRLRWLVDVEWYYRMLKGSRCHFDTGLCIESVHGHEGQISQTLHLPETFLKDKAILLPTYRNNTPVRLMLWLYQSLILRKKHLSKRYEDR